MFDVIIPARSGRQRTINAIESMLHSCSVVGFKPHLILIDDASDPEHCMAGVMSKYADATVLRCMERQHYTGVFHIGIEHSDLAKDVFFLSNDMIVTPDFVAEVLDVAKVERAGIVRGTSNWCDSHPDYTTPLPRRFVPRKYDDVAEFSRVIRRFYGGTYASDDFLSGDAVLVKRDLINAIGNLDTQFYGYFGDPDYGIRARRAGFKLLCATGAWLYHEGAGHIRDERVKAPDVDANAERMKLVQAAYEKFRAKWDTGLPPIYSRDISMGDQFPWAKYNDPAYQPPGKITA